MDKRKLVKVCRHIYSAPANVNTDRKEHEDHRIFVLFIAPSTFVVMTGQGLNSKTDVDESRVAILEWYMSRTSHMRNIFIFRLLECKRGLIVFV